jgi:hypothetical protein
MPEARAVAITDPIVDSIVLSPPIQIACTPRETSDCTASVTAALVSTLASSSVMPRSRHASRAFFVKASEFDSAGFQATPTRDNPGSARRAIAKLSATGRNEPCPTSRAGASADARDPADARAERIGHQREHVHHAAVAIGIGDGLH